ncbi:MAG TPA: hypothetical protein VK797_10660 [Tepidisphaeraceae bacterium]|nr:hypothetical protein [Tepidisphaeraceae bacterium]
MAIWPFRSKARQPSGPKFEDDAFVDLARMFLRFPQDPTPGNELLDASRFDLSVESLGAMDEHLERMRLRDLEGQDLLKFVLRGGAYVGEVIRRHTPMPRQWHWVDYDQAVALGPNLAGLGKGLGTIAVLWDGTDRFTFPLAKVGKYLQNGPEDSVQFYAQVIIAGPPPSEVESIQVGGLYATRADDGSWRVTKVLAMDEFAVHLRSYANKFAQQPTEVDPAKLTIGGLNDPAGFGVGHFPMAKQGFLAGNPMLIKVVPVAEDELEGYRIYLEAMRDGGTATT